MSHFFLPDIPSLANLPPQTRQAKVRFDSAAEELERLLLLKSGEPPRDLLFSGPPSTSSSSLSNANMLTNQKGGGTFGKAMSKLKGPRSVAQIQRMEEESRTRMGQANDSYRAQVLGAREVRSEWFGKNLPWILRVRYPPLELGSMVGLNGWN